MRKSKKKKNNVCVIGIGRFGSAVVDELLNQDIPVIAIDMNEKELSRYSNIPLVTPIVADASDIKILQEIGVDEIETVIVGTPNNIEIVATLLELNLENIIARAATIRHARVLKQIGVDLIVRPEIEAGTRTALIAANANFIKFSKSLTELGNGFVIGSFQLLNFNFVNKSLKDLKLNNFNITLVLIKRGNETILPNANVYLNLGDELTVVGKIEHVTKFSEIVNQGTPERIKIKSRKD